MPMIDTPSRAIEDMIVDAQDAKRQVFLVGTRPKVKSFLKKQKIWNFIEADHIYDNRLDALCHAAKTINIDPEICRP